MLEREVTLIAHWLFGRLYRWLPVVALCAAGCASAGAPAARTALPQAAPPSADLASAAIASSAPKEPTRIVFDWSLRDRDAHFTGRGAARVEPPYRARLDLFGPRGESYLSAAVVGDSVRLPPNVTAQVPLPPPALLWSALGVLQPPPGARLVSSREQDGELSLEYTRGDEHWSFTLNDGHVRRAELERGTTRQTIETSGKADRGLPKEAVYRDYAAYRELTLTLDQANAAQSFPPETWTPGRP